MKDREKGFTFIELLVVLVILGLMMVIGVPMMQRLITKSKLTQVILEIDNIIKATRAEAIRTGHRGVVEFYESDNRIDAFIDITDTGSATAEAGDYNYAFDDAGVNFKRGRHDFKVTPNGYTLPPRVRNGFSNCKGSTSANLPTPSFYGSSASSADYMIVFDSLGKLFRVENNLVFCIEDGKENNFAFIVSPTGNVRITKWNKDFSLYTLQGRGGVSGGKRVASWEWY